MVGFLLIMNMGAVFYMGGWRRNIIYLIILGVGAPLFTLYLCFQSGESLTISNVASMADLGGMLWAAFVGFLKAIKMGLNAWDERRDQGTHRDG